MKLQAATFVCTILGTFFSTNSAIANVENTSGRWDGTTSLTRSNSLYNMNDGTESATLDAALVVVYAKNNWVAGLNLEATQDLKRTENSDLSLMLLSAKRRNLPLLNESVLMSLGAAVSWPVSKDQRLRQNLIAGTTVNIRLDMNQDKTSFRRISLGGALSATRNFHEYEQKTDGLLNTQYSSKQAVDSTYKVSEKISVCLMLAHINTFSYSGGQRESYAHSEEVGFDTSKTTNVALGHQLGGSIRKSNGEDYNIQLTDDNQSIVYASFAMSF